MTDRKKDLIPSSTKTESRLEITSLISSVVPWIGGPVSNVLSGMSLGRKMKRVSEVLESLASDLSDFKSDVSEKYVNTEEFEDLLEQTLKRVSEERNVEKRQVYKAFLSDVIKSPGQSYDDQLQQIRTFEQLSPDHLVLLKAIFQEPESDYGRTGSPVQTLRRRIPEFDDVRIEELANQINDMRITDLGSLRVLMTGRGAADLRSSITNYGEKIINYINRK